VGLLLLAVVLEQRAAARFHFVCHQSFLSIG